MQTSSGPVELRAGGTTHTSIQSGKLATTSNVYILESSGSNAATTFRINNTTTGRPKCSITSFTDGTDKKARYSGEADALGDVYVDMNLS